LDHVIKPRKKLSVFSYQWSVVSQLALIAFTDN
jgi:hypothetical protein